MLYNLTPLAKKIIYNIDYFVVMFCSAVQNNHVFQCSLKGAFLPVLSRRSSSFQSCPEGAFSPVLSVYHMAQGSFNGREELGRDSMPFDLFGQNILLHVVLQMVPELRIVLCGSLSSLQSVLKNVCNYSHLRPCLALYQ